MLYPRVMYNVEIRQVQQQRKTLYPRVTYNVEIRQAQQQRVVISMSDV